MSEVNVGIETLCNVEASFDGVNLNVNVEVCPAGAEFTQIQSDWNQSDNTAVDYIKNKPTIDTALSAVSRIGVNLTGSGTVLDPLKFQAVDWAADTLYRTLQLITYEGELYRVATEFTSGATFDATNLERIEPKVATPVTPDYTAITVGDKLQDVAEKVAGLQYQNKVNALGSVSGAVQIDLTLGSYVTGTLTDATQFTFTGLPPSGYVKDFVILLTNIQTITFPVGTKFAGGVPPVVITSPYMFVCSIDSAGVVTVYTLLDNIIVPV